MRDANRITLIYIKRGQPRESEHRNLAIKADANLDKGTIYNFFIEIQGVNTLLIIQIGTRIDAKNEERQFNGKL